MGERIPWLYAGLATGVVAVGWAAIFIRLAAAPALTVSAYRMALAAAPLIVWAALTRRRELAGLDRGSLTLLAISGVALAVHFATWIASLSYTTVASSVALVTTQPVWVALLSAALLGEPVRRRMALAIALATVGGLMIAGADLRLSGAALWGDLLALLGAVCAAIYFIAGRRVRQTLSLASYVAVVYGLAAVALWAGAVAAGQPLAGFATGTWVMLGLLALVPQLIGHSLLNWTLRYLSAPAVSVAILGEPVISTALAVPLLGEAPGPLRLAGGAVTLAGVYLAMRDEAGVATREPAPASAVRRDAG